MGIHVEHLHSSTEKKEPVESTAPVKRVRVNYIQELKEELSKVTWTSKEELLSCTKIVVGSTFFLGLTIYLMDLCIKGALGGFSRIIHFIFG